MIQLTMLTSSLGKHNMVIYIGAQDELLRNRCPAGRLDVWQRGVDTEEFHPRHRSRAMRERMSGGRPDSPILVYIGRLGPGTVPLSRLSRHISWR